MFEVKDSDLKLSDNFKKIQEELNKESKEIVSLQTTKINQTVEAVLLFRSNIKTLKQKVKGFQYINKFNYLYKYLIDTFPNADKKIIKKEIIKLGYLPYNLLLYINIFSSFILNSIINIILWSHYPYYVLIQISCGFLIWTLILDSYICSKK